MRLALANELKQCPDGTIWTVHGPQNGNFLPIGGFRIKRASQYSKDASFRPNWYMAFSRLCVAPVRGHSHALRAGVPEFDPTVQSGTTIMIWDDGDIKELQALLKAAKATKDNPELDLLVTTYDFDCGGLKLNTKTGQGEYLNKTFKLSPMQVKALLLISSTFGQRTVVTPVQLVEAIGPNSSDPYSAVNQLIARTLKAVGHPLGGAMCPIVKTGAGTYYWVGNGLR